MEPVQYVLDSLSEVRTTIQKPLRVRPMSKVHASDLLLPFPDLRGIRHHRLLSPFCRRTSKEESVMADCKMVDIKAF